MTAYHFERLLPHEFAERLSSRPVLIVPFGTLEWHSDHAPLGLDGLVAASTCESIADKTDAVLAPVSYWSVGGIAFPFTLKLPIDVIEPLTVAVLTQFASMGFRVLTAFTGHFAVEQLLMLKRAALSVMESTSATVIPLCGYELIGETWQGDHAGSGETSMLWAAHPSLIDLDRLPEKPDGIVGRDPRGSASAELGGVMLRQIAGGAAALTLRLLDADAMERSDFIEATRAAVRVLDALAAMRATLPKSTVPPLTTRPWLDYCAAVTDGRFRDARAAAEAKLTELTNQ